MNLGIVGATGNVGTMLLKVLLERGIQVENLRAFASARSAGTTVQFGALTIEVEDLATADPAGLDFAIFSAGGQRALDHAPRFAEAGCTVIDNSSAFRMHADVPLVVPEVNADAVSDRPRNIIANPNCSTIQLLVALNPIHQKYGIKRLQVTTMQSTSGTGHAAMTELIAQSAGSLAGEQVDPLVYPHQIAFNVIPHCDDFNDDGDTKEELKLVNESRKILGESNLRVSATCTRVPVLVGHAEAVNLELREAASPADIRELLTDAPGVAVMDDPAGGRYPMPLAAHGSDEVFVGRIRQDRSLDDGKGISLFICADNLRKGAATNAVQILELVQRVAAPARGQAN